MTEVYTLRAFSDVVTLVPVLGGEDFRGGTSPLCNILPCIVVSWLLSSVPPRETIWDINRLSLYA